MKEEVRKLLTFKPERHVSKLLPLLIEEYNKQEKPVATSELINLIAFWMSNLEKRLYKNNKLFNQRDYDRRLDRVLLFLEYARENRHRDGAYLMSAYGFLFPYAELFLQCRGRKVVVADEAATITKKLQHPDLKFLRVFYTILAQLAEKGLPVTYDNILSSWREYRTGKQGKSPGRIATANFSAKVQKFLASKDAIRTLEHSWFSRSTLHEANVS